LVVASNTRTDFQQMSIEVYIINLVIGVVTFFILRWTLKRFVKADKLRIGLTWTGTIILTPIIYIGLIIGFFSVLFRQPTVDFNKEKWFADKEIRYQMRDDLVNSKILENKSKKEVTDLLGLPDFGTDTTNIWDYDLGTSGAGFGWQFNSLIVTFDNERVTTVKKKEIVD
jgi:hypothetical protein